MEKRRVLERHFARTGLSLEGEQAKRDITISFIRLVGQRAVAVFLGKDDYEKVKHTYSPVMAGLLMECLPAFVSHVGGEIILDRLFVNDEVLNSVEQAVTVNGSTRRIITDGYVFIHLPNERVVVSAEAHPRPIESTSSILIRSNSDPVAFFKQWEAFARTNNYLRGKAFFADGELIERKKKYTWDDIQLPENTKCLIRTHVEAFIRNRLVLKDLGVKTRRGLILEGPPGTGKTLLGKVLAETLDVSFMWVSPRHVDCPLSFQSILSLARFVAPTVVFWEDLDLFAEDRLFRGSTMLGEMMNQLDGAVDNESLVMIATTNRLEVIERALRNRPGRFDRILKFDPPDETCRHRMFTKLLARATISPEDMAHLVSATNGYTGAQIEELANTLYILAVDACNGSSDNGDSPRGSISIDRGLIKAALKEVRLNQRGKMGFYVT